MNHKSDAAVTRVYCAHEVRVFSPHDDLYCYAPEQVERMMEMDAWCRANTKGRYGSVHYLNTRYMFELKEEAAMFKLFFGVGMIERNDQGVENV